jgi:tRNA G46 methylase TrmB
VLVFGMKEGFIMNDDQIKEILIALINNGQLCTGTDNKSIAENIALFINTLKQELKEVNSLRSTMTLEEIAAQIPDIDVIMPD